MGYLIIKHWWKYLNPNDTWDIDPNFKTLAENFQIIPNFKEDIKIYSNI